MAKLTRVVRIPLVLLVCSLGLLPAGAQTKRPAASKAKKSAVETAPAPPPKPRTPAEKVSDTLQEFIVQADLRGKGKNPPEKQARFSEDELNAYVQEAIKAKARFGITSVAIKLIGPNYLGATASVDFGKVNVEDQSLGVRMVRSMLSGEKQIYIEGTIIAGGGKGQFKLEKAYLGQVRLPVYFIEKVLNFLGHRQTPPIDTSQPVPLPYGLKNIEVGTGSVLLRG